MDLDAIPLDIRNHLLEHRINVKQASAVFHKILRNNTL